MKHQDMHLILELSAPIHHLVSKLEHSSFTCAQVMDDVDKHISVYRTKLAELGLTVDQVNTIIYATSAFADELVMRSKWAHRTEWARRPLCVHYFNDAHAGRHFFERIHLLRDAPVSNALPLWHYWRCLQMGFEGQYRNSDGRILRDTLLSLETGLKEAGFSAHKTPELKFDVGSKKGVMRPAWPVWRYLAIAILAVPVTLLLINDILFYESISQFNGFLEAGSESLYEKIQNFKS